MQQVGSFYLSLESLADFLSADGTVKLQRIEPDTASILGKYIIVGTYAGQNYWLMDDAVTVKTFSLDTAMRLMREHGLEHVELRGSKRGKDSRAFLEQPPWMQSKKKKIKLI